MDFSWWRTGDGRLGVFVFGMNNAFYAKWQTSAGSSTWSASWQPLGGTFRDNSDPEVALNTNGRFEVFAVASNAVLPWLPN